ncbi:hypothetical protein FA09DRAFT_331808 [Tilletiopsis washingtonensis]|jgi:hypothetical protein|uniref:Uncharacterized protein n=1 Tax=Tilletiopsis washingtonensis TaxID=58919 RepID=A0A316Z459_9BASI|nr:hypothetical protein FA09DRAFT_331808 [Tilletiopsis washingtonensis]PWN95864.1 hypothetical protein FA09DRAFT_331808 [Tilletiopsis washingtonensis]
MQRPWMAANFHLLPVGRCDLLQGAAEAVFASSKSACCSSGGQAAVLLASPSPEPRGKQTMQPARPAACAVKGPASGPLPLVSAQARPCGAATCGLRPATCVLGARQRRRETLAYSASAMLEEHRVGDRRLAWDWELPTTWPRRSSLLPEHLPPQDDRPRRDTFSTPISCLATAPESQPAAASVLHLTPRKAARRLALKAHLRPPHLPSPPLRPVGAGRRKAASRMLLHQSRRLVRI